MSNIPRLYCIVLIEKNTNIFCNVCGITSTIEEAKEFAATHNNLLANPDTYTHIIVPVIATQQ